MAFAVPGIRVAGEVGRSSASDQGLLPGTLQVRYDLPPGAAEVAVTMAVVPSAIDTSAMQPFKPMLVAKFGERIRWSTSGPLKHDGDVVAPLVVEGTVGKATMAVPKGATFLVLQVANGGGADGAFRNLSITAANAAPAQELVQGTEPESGGLFGVRCSTVGVAKPLPPSLFAVALAMVQGAALRRRGRHRSASSPTASNQTASKSTLSKSNR